MSTEVSSAPNTPSRPRRAGPLARFASDYKWTMLVLGALLTVPSAVAVIEGEFALGLAPAFQRLVDFYIAAANDFANALRIRQWIFLRELPREALNHAIEMLPVALLGASMMFRAIAGALQYFLSGVILAALVSLSWFLVLMGLPERGVALLLAFAQPLMISVFALRLLKIGTGWLSWRLVREAWIVWAVTCAGVVAFYFGSLIGSQ